MHQKKCVVSLWTIILSMIISASYAADISTAVMTPNKVVTSIGDLEFNDGAPTQHTVAKLYDNLDLMHGVNSFLTAYQGASTYAIRQGFLSIGAADNSVVIFSKLMDAKSLFLTANADTIYFISFIDLSKGPMVVETPPGALGTFDDFWLDYRFWFARP